MFKPYFIFIFCCVFCFQSFSQGNFILRKGNKDRINFKLIHNLIVIPVEINGAKLSFLLDTGISKSIIFNFLNLREDLQINQAESIYLRGLGEGKAVEALKSRNNVFRIGKAININQDIYAIFDPSLNFAPRLGVPIHGIIGYDLLKDFVVEVNYSNKYIKLHDPDTYKPKKCKKCKSLPIEFHNNKPYIIGSISINGNSKQVKLLIDSGGSDALWLFDDEDITIPDKFFEDFLGRGLSGSVYGKRSKLDKFSIAGFELKKVNVAFPDSMSVSYAKKIKDRNGSLGGEILKRFNIILDYPNSKITLKRNRFFSNPFYYNLSGITLEHNGVRMVKEIDRGSGITRFNSNSESAGSVTVFVTNSYRYLLASAFTIVELREDSPAKNAGLKLEDVILAVNNKDAHLYSLQDIIQMFYGEDGNRISLLIDRKGVQLRFNFRLEKLL
ncbi:PDZ domain-containing protein [Flavobacteriaceae bacterium PRS1]|nr:PDZ domain-containing protein [Flavobacteriaceae bacterium PRS1]